LSLGVGLACGLGAATSDAQSSYPAPYTIKTLAGTHTAYGFANGTGSAALFRTPFGVAVDSLGNVYVADTLNYVIRLIAPGGIVTTIAGTPGNKSYADGTGSAAAFSNPTGVAVDSLGNIYVADSENYDIRMITPGGVVSTLAGKTGIPGSID
jgi:hypothetical protein